MHVHRRRLNYVTRSKSPDRIANQPKAWWQRAIAGERLPKPLFRQPKCEGTIEDHRMIALDVRELTRRHVFEQPVGSVFHLDLRYLWLRVLRLNSSTLDLQLASGRRETVYLAWARCGVLGERIRFLCPRCRRRVCLLYHLDGQLDCRRCSGLWYAAQRISANARKFRSMKMVRRKLGDYGQFWAANPPPKPRGMWRRTYTRHCAALARIERSLYLPRRRY
jgi:hypothetical protein